MKNKPQPRCVVRESLEIRDILKRIWKDKRQKQIVKEANEDGIAITEASLSRYIKEGNISGAITAEQIILLCEKYGILLSFKVKLKRK